MESNLDSAGVYKVLSCVLDGIFLASHLSMGLRKALAFRAVEPSWREHGCLRRLVPQERIHERVVEQTVAFPVLPLKEEIVEVAEEDVNLVQQERVRERTVENAPVPQFLEETVECFRFWKKPLRWY